VDNSLPVEGEMTSGTKRLHDSSVSRNLGTSVTPAAIRSTKPGWRDPRLWIGVAIVAASVLLGAKLIGGAEQSVAVWSVSRDLSEGDDLTAADLVERKVRFVNAADADVYVSAEEPLPEGMTLTREVQAGELLPRSAFGSSDAAGRQTMSLSFSGPGVPAGLDRGDRVAVWATSLDKTSTGTKVASSTGRSIPIDTFDTVLVTDVQRASESLSGATGMTVTIALPEAPSATGFAQLVQAAKTDNVFLVKVG